MSSANEPCCAFLSFCSLFVLVIPDTPILLTLMHYYWILHHNGAISTRGHLSLTSEVFVSFAKRIGIIDESFNWDVLVLNCLRTEGSITQVNGRLNLSWNFNWSRLRRPTAQSASSKVHAGSVGNERQPALTGPPAPAPWLAPNAAKAAELQLVGSFARTTG